MVRTIRRTVEAGLVPTLEVASTFVELGTPRPLDSFPGQPGGPPRERTDLGELIGSFIESPFPPLQVMAAAMLPMLSDELLSQRIRRQLATTRIPAAPTWVDVLDRPEVVATKLMTDPLGDGDNLMIAMSWPGRRAAVAVVYIDHNMGTIVKDAFTVPDTLETTMSVLEQVGPDAPAELIDIDPADARARITAAIRQGERTIPPLETDTWPAVRPLVEWWASLLPEGGQGYDHREWTSDELDGVVEHFVASSFAAATELPDDEVRLLADPMAWFAAGTVPGDPLRWSPVVVEIALTDWLPRKVLAPKDQIAHIPTVMSAFVRFAHAERGVQPHDTDETLTAIERWTPDFLEAIEGPPASPARNAVRLARLAAGLDPDDFDDEFDDNFDDDFDLDVFDVLDDLDVDFDLDLDDDQLLGLLDRWEQALIAVIGGPEAVDELDDLPLPDVAFDRSVVSEALTDLVDDVLHRVDAVCDSHLDVEFRTICRHHLAEVVAADARLFERSTRTDLIAAGLVWATISLQRTGASGPDDVLRDVPTQKELAAAMDVNPSSMSQRAQSIRSTLEYQTAVTRTGPWHSRRRRRWLEELSEVSRLRIELGGTDQD